MNNHHGLQETISQGTKTNTGPLVSRPSEIILVKFSLKFHLGNFRFVKILEGTFMYSYQYCNWRK